MGLAEGAFWEQQNGGGYSCRLSSADSKNEMVTLSRSLGLGRLVLRKFVATPPTHSRDGRSVGGKFLQ